MIYRGNVKPARNFLPLHITEVQGDLAVAFPFALIHRLGGKPERVALPCLDLYKAVITVFKSHDIRLAEGRFKIAFYNFIAVFF